MIDERINLDALVSKAIVIVIDIIPAELAIISPDVWIQIWMEVINARITYTYNDFIVASSCLPSLLEMYGIECVRLIVEIKVV